MKHYYRISNKQKQKIAENLIDILVNNIAPTNDTRIFIGNWILTERSEKFKAYYDVWELVLANYYPESRPILFRGISRKSKSEYIASFTGSAYTAERFSNDNGYWIVCDTKYSLLPIQPYHKKGNYCNTFYPLGEVLQKAKNNNGWGFSDSLLRNHSGEDEYIMKIDYSFMKLLKYIK